jgi:hypothetical protein
MPSNYLQTSREIYNNASLEYERHYFNDKRLLKKITLIFNNGYSESLTREEIENGQRFH